MKAIGNNIIVKQDILEKISKSGIILPNEDIRNKKMQSGIVLSIGEKVKDIKIGDKVFYNMHSGEFLNGNDEKLGNVILKAETIYCIESSNEN